MATTPSVYGVRETLAELRAISPELQKECQANIKAAARPLQEAVAGRIPSGPPLSGFNHKGRTGWTTGGRRVRTKLGGRKRKGANEWPLLSVIVSGSAASIYDMAGRGSSSNLSQQLGSRHGSASRAAWPGAEASLQAVQASVVQAVDATMRKANQQLVQRPAGAP